MKKTWQEEQRLQELVKIQQTQAGPVLVYISKSTFN